MARDTVPLITDAELRRLRSALVRELRGTVVELGAGEGANLDDLDPDVRWIGTEPNRRFRATLAQEAARKGFDAPRDARAEEIPVTDAGVDAVLSTLVFCSVDDLDRAMAESRRVLRPGGRLVFVEHVIAPKGTGMRFVQQLATPFTALMDHNCHWNRDPVAAAERAGFGAESVRAVGVTGRLPGGAVPFVLYAGRKPDSP